MIYIKKREESEKQTFTFKLTQNLLRITRTNHIRFYAYLKQM